MGYSKYKDIDLIISGYLSLVSFPDISKWNISNVIGDIYQMFEDCISLSYFPEYEKISGNAMFKNCFNLVVKKPLLIELENEEDENNDEN